MEILSFIAKFLNAPLIAMLALAGFHVPTATEYSALVQDVRMAQETQEQNLGTAVANTVAGFETSLASSLTNSDTQMTLVSFTTDDGTDLEAGKTYAFTIDEGSASREFVIGTATSSNVIENLTRGISVVDGATEVTANKKSHRRGASVKITNFQLVTITNILNDTATIPSPLRYASEVATTSFSNAQHLTSKAYVDYVAFNGAGVIDATESARGVVELATQLEMASSTSAGSSGPLALQSKYSTTTGGVSGHWIPVTGNDGTISTDFIPVSITQAYSKASAFYGDGSDGDLVIAGGATTTLTADAYYNDLTVNGLLVTNGFRVFVAGTLDGTGKIKVPDANDGGAGTNGTDNGSTQTQGVAGASYATGVFPNRAGTNGSTAPTVDVGGLGNPGGTAWHGGGRTQSLAPYNSVGIPFVASFNYGMTASPVWGVDFTGTSTMHAYLAPAGGQGGQSGVISSNAGGGTQGGAGGAGGGGASGGVVWIVANVWAGSFTIEALGGDGGDAGDSLNGYYTVGQSTGGAGGAGGVSVVFYGTKTWTGTYNLAGGTAGAVGGGTYDTSAGGNSEDGDDGVSYEISFN